MALPRLFGDVAFRYDPISEAVIVTSIGADGQNPVSISNGLVTESTAHARIEAGNTFVHNNVHTGIAAGASYYHILSTGSVPIHLTIFAATADAAPIWVEIREGDTYTGGTPGVLLNKNRNSALTSSCTVTEGVTISVAGVHLEGDFVTGTRQSGGSARIDEEWILSPNKKYAILTRNDSTGAASISFHLEFYEAA